MDKTADIIRRLPEFPLEPFELAGVLDHSDRGPYLTIRPHPQTAPTPPVTSPSAALKKSSHAIRKYFTQAIYPRVICHDPGDLLVGFRMDLGQAPAGEGSETRPDVAALARRERFYKLSTFKKVELPRPYWCSVKYGPWLAIAVERESCIDGDQNLWEFFIVEVPEVALTWYGEWDDMPPYPSLQVTMGDKVLASQERHCCAEFEWCATTQSCIPMAVDCQDAYPV